MRWLGAVLLLAVACSDKGPTAAPSTAPPATAPATIPGTTPPATTPPATTAPPTTPPPTTGAPTTAAPARVDYVFPVAGCRVTYGRAHHDYPATDIFARAGCAFVSPVAGRVDEVGYRDEWDSESNRGADRGGIFVSVVGVDGVRYYGSHLSRVAPGIEPGVSVQAGTRLGDVGITGSARDTPPHLHFGLSWPTRPGVWWVRRGVIHPWPYLDSWRAGGDKSPVSAVEAERKETGTDVPPCPSYC